MRYNLTNRRVCSAATSLLLAALCAPADTVELTDGTVATGTYAGGTPEVIRLNTPDGTRDIPRADAVRLTFIAPKPPPATPAAPPQAQPLPAANIPAGTLLLVRMQTPVSSRDAAGKKFAAVLETDLRAGNDVVVKAGTPVYGRVEAAKQAGRMVGKSSLQLALTDVNVGGSNVPIMTSNFAEAGQGSFKKTARNTLVGAGVGSAFGDAGKGAAVGAGASVIREGQTVTVPANAILEFRLVEPMQLPVSPK